MLVSTMFAGGSAPPWWLRGYRLHITNLEDRVFTYTVRYWVTPPSEGPARLNESFFLSTWEDESKSGWGAWRSQEHPSFRRTDNGVYTASWSVLVLPNHTVLVEFAPVETIVPVGFSAIFATLSVEGYVTLELPVMPDADFPFRSVPQADGPVRVLLNPETSMKQYHGLMNDLTGNWQFDDPPDVTVEPLITASGKAENEVTPNGVQMLTAAALREAVHSTRINEAAVRSFGGAEHLPAADRMRMLIQLLCELDNQKKVLVELNKVLSKNLSGVMVRQRKN